MCEGAIHLVDEESARSRSLEGDELVPGARSEADLTVCGDDDRWGQTSVSESDHWVMSSTWDMDLDSTGEQGCRAESVGGGRHFTLVPTLDFSSG